jgi:hypothetical protein
MGPDLSPTGLEKPNGDSVGTWRGAGHPNSASLNFFHRDVSVLSSVKVGENHVVLDYGRERPMY